jgi:hypothetical protein
VKISVGLGTGNKDSQMAQLMQMFQVQMGAMPTGTVNPQNIYSTLYEIAKTAGFATPEKFVNDPAANPPPAPQPPPEIMIAQMKAQTDSQIAQVKSQADAQLEMAKLQQEGQLQQMQMAFDKWKVEFEAQTKLQIEAMRIGETRELEREKLMASSDMENRRITSAESIKSAELQRGDEDMAERKAMEALMQQVNALKEGLTQIVQMQDGKRVMGIERVRDKSGRMIAGRVKRADGSVEEVTIQ